MPAPARRARSAARSSASSASGASSRSARPAVVSSTWRLVRTNRSVPRLRSSLWIWLLSDGGDVQARGGPAEMELLRDGHEVAEQARLEIDSRSLTLCRSTCAVMHLLWLHVQPTRAV